MLVFGLLLIVVPNVFEKNLCKNFNILTIAVPYISIPLVNGVIVTELSSGTDNYAVRIDNV